MKKLEHPLSNFLLCLINEVKQLPLQLQLRVKQEVFQSASKARLDALLDGLTGTSGLSTRSFYKTGICLIMIVFTYHVITCYNFFMQELFCLNKELVTY
jgi:hypothetical protein